MLLRPIYLYLSKCNLLCNLFLWGGDVSEIIIVYIYIFFLITYRERESEGDQSINQPLLDLE